MPRSKRSKVVHTSRVQKTPSKTRSLNLFTQLRAAAATHSTLLLFSVADMRNTYLKDVRTHFASDSRLFYGKTKVMAKALGTTPENEVMPGVAKMGGLLKGDMGVLCTDRPIAEVLEFFQEFSGTDFARAGTKASRRFAVPQGVVYSTGGEVAVEDDVPLPHSMEAMVRKCGMPTKLEKGKVMLEQEYVVCKDGQTLDSNQTSLLKTFGIAMAEFRVKVVAYWTAGSEEVTVVDDEEADVMEE